VGGEREYLLFSPTYEHCSVTGKIELDETTRKVAALRTVFTCFPTTLALLSSVPVCSSSKVLQSPYLHSTPLTAFVRLFQHLYCLSEVALLLHIAAVVDELCCGWVHQPHKLLLSP